MEPETTEEMRQLRTAVAALTKLTHALMRVLIQTGTPLPAEFLRFAKGLRLEVLDDQLRERWEAETAATEQVWQASRPYPRSEVRDLDDG